MRQKVFVCVLILISCFYSCKDDDSPTQYLQIVAELPVYCANSNEQGLISKDELVNKVFVYNSKEDVKNNFTEAFLNKFPDYLHIDFTKYSLLVKTSIVDYEILNKKISFYLKNRDTQNIYHYQIDYYVGEQCADNEYFIERSAIVVDKIMGNNIVESGYSYSKQYK